MLVTNVALLINTNAGKGNALQVATVVEQELINRHITYSRFNNTWCTSLDAFTEVWVIGGDGTLNYFLNQYTNCSIPIVIFKGGTGNDVAWKLYGDISTQAQIQLILKATAKPIDAGMCNNTIFINGIGIGFDGEVLQSMNTIRCVGGHFGYLLAVIKKIFSFKEYSFTISLDGKIIAENFLLMMVFNSSRTGGGFYIAPTALINDGFLNMVLCKPLSILQRLRYLPIIEKGKHLHLPFIQHQTCKSISITCEKESPAQCDGELIYAKSFVIKVLEGKFFFKM